VEKRWPRDSGFKLNGNGSDSVLIETFAVNKIAFCKYGIASRLKSRANAIDQVENTFLYGCLGYIGNYIYTLCLHRFDLITF